ncbi:hypothetical protein NHG32_02950 [Aerococcaceae bacterium NML191219]|nr:hypothetical protein [Aerococcaceae bacterium NML191219]
MKNAKFKAHLIWEKYSTQQLYFIALVITLVANFFSQTVLVEIFPFLVLIFKIVRVFAVCILAIKLMLERAFLHPSFLWGCIVGFYVLIVAIVTDNYLALLPLFAFIYSGYNVAFDKIIRISCIVSLICMGITQILYGLGYFYSVDAVRGLTVAEGIRKSVGYTFVSFGSNYFFHVALMYVFVRKSAISWFEILGMAIINFYFYMETDTKAAFWLVNLLLVVWVIAKFCKIHRSSAIKKIERYALLVSSLSIVFVTELYRWQPYLLDKLNVALSGRLFEGAKAVDIYGYSLIGKRIEWVFYGDNPLYGESYLYADSSFVNIMLNYGMMTLVILIVGFYFIPYIYKKNDIFYTIPFLFLVIHSIFDPQFMELYYNPFLLILGGLFSRRGVRFFEDYFQAS